MFLSKLNILDYKLNSLNLQNMLKEDNPWRNFDWKANIHQHSYHKKLLILCNYYMGKDKISFLAVIIELNFILKDGYIYLWYYV